MAEKEKIRCIRCGKMLAKTSFYLERSGKPCQYCKNCLTAHVDNFDESTFVWILKKLDFPYLPKQWNVLRDRAFDKDPYKMNGTSVLGKYLAKMRLKDWKDHGFDDSYQLIQISKERKQKFFERELQDRKKFQQEMLEKKEKGEISQAEYKTLVSTETQKNLLGQNKRDVITGQLVPTNYQEAIRQYEEKSGISQIKSQIPVPNPFIEKNFVPEEELADPAAELSSDDKILLAMKWGRYYTPNQWVTLEQLYTQFIKDFGEPGAARKDTLKMICKTSLKMNQAIDMGDIQTYQKLSRVYDTLMKSGKFTEAQNKESDSKTFDSISSLVDFVQAKSGGMPKYKCNQPRDIIDKVISDLKDYTKSLIYEDKSLAQEIEKYLQDKRISEEMKQDKKQAKSQGLTQRQLKERDYIEYRRKMDKMMQHDMTLDEMTIEEEYIQRQVQKRK